jgi:hypothetical protein
MDGRAVRIITKSFRILTIFGVALFIIVKAETYSALPGGAVMPVILCAMLSVLLVLTGIFMALEEEREL